jgi:membrane protease YdiL (CAAX protease family)
LELIVAIVLLSALFVLWVVTLFVLVNDTISAGAKILWFVLVTLLAPVAIPVYYLLRRRRASAREQRVQAGRA